MSVVITPVNVARVTEAVKAQLTAHPDLAEVKIERSEDHNSNPNSCPWVGIYRSSVQYQERVLGFGGGVRDQLVRLIILIQASNQNSGEECEEELEGLVQTVVGALLSDTTLGGTVATIREFDVEYPAYERSGNLYMQTAALQLVAVGNTTAA